MIVTLVVTFTDSAPRCGRGFLWQDCDNRTTYLTVDLVCITRGDAGRYARSVNVDRESVSVRTVGYATDSPNIVLPNDTITNL